MKTPRSDTGLTRDQVRELDRRAIEEFGIPGIVLMENAGRNAAAIIIERVPPGGAVAIVCGRGNNGGDGFVIARHLANAAVSVEVFLTCRPDQLTGDAAVNHKIVERMALPIVEFDTHERIQENRSFLEKASIIVDAILGTGFAGQVRAPLDRVISIINETRMASAATPRPLRVIAVDVPSGMDCNTGQASNATVRADETVTFVARKIGFDAPDAIQYTGQIHVAEIGVPRGLIDAVHR